MAAPIMKKKGTSPTLEAPTPIADAMARSTGDRKYHCSA